MYFDRENLGHTRNKVIEKRLTMTGVHLSGFPRIYVKDCTPNPSHTHQYTSFSL